jgi:hypothetical protein
MAVNPKQRVAPHKHSIADIISGNFAALGYGRVGNIDLSSYVKKDSAGYINVAGVNFGDGYPCIGRNTVNGNYVVEVIMPNGTQAADVSITGNLNVGRMTGGLAVNGVIGLSGDLSGNCYVQFGTASSTSTGLVQGAIRIAKTDTYVLSMQSYVAATQSWQLANVNVSILFADFINSATTLHGGGIYFGDAIRLYSGTAGVKLYDSTNQAPASSFLSTDANGLPKWVDKSQTWNGGTISNPITFSGSGGRPILISATGNELLGTEDNGVWLANHAGGTIHTLWNTLDDGYGSVIIGNELHVNGLRALMTFKPDAANRHIHMFNNYTKPVGETFTIVYYGYDSQIDEWNWQSKASGVNRQNMTLTDSLGLWVRGRVTTGEHVIVGNQLYLSTEKVIHFNNNVSNDFYIGKIGADLNIAAPSILLGSNGGTVKVRGAFDLSDCGVTIGYASMGQSTYSDPIITGGVTQYFWEISANADQYGGHIKHPSDAAKASLIIDGYLNVGLGLAVSGEFGVSNGNIALGTSGKSFMAANENNALPKFVTWYDSPSNNYWGIGQEFCSLFSRITSTGGASTFKWFVGAPNHPSVPGSTNWIMQLNEGGTLSLKNNIVIDSGSDQQIALYCIGANPQFIRNYMGTVYFYHQSPSAAPQSTWDSLGTLSLAGSLWINGSNYIKFPAEYGDGNDGKIGSGLFQPGLNIIGCNTDNTTRKIHTWGHLTMHNGNFYNSDGFVQATNGFRVNDYAPLIGANSIDGHYFLEVVYPATPEHPNGLPGDFYVTGNMTVGRDGGGLSVTGTIGTSGSWFQMGNDTAAMRMYKNSVTSGDVTRTAISFQDYSQGSWLLSNINASMIMVDHLKSASNGGMYLFDALRLCYSPNGSSYTGIKVYDGYNTEGTEGYVLTATSTGTTQWKIPQWTAGVINTLDPTCFQIINTSTNNITEANYDRVSITSGLQASKTLNFTPNTSRLMILTSGSSHGATVSGISQSGVTWTKVNDWSNFSASPIIAVSMWLGRVTGTPSNSVTVTYDGNSLTTTTCAAVDIVEYSGVDSVNPITVAQYGDQAAGSPVNYSMTSSSYAASMMIAAFVTNGTTMSNNAFPTFNRAWDMQNVGNVMSVGILQRLCVETETKTASVLVNGANTVMCGLIVKAASQDGILKLSLVGSGGGGTATTYIGSSPIEISGNVISFNGTGYALSCASVSAPDVYATHFKSSADSSAYLQNLAGSSGWLTTSGGFNVNGDVSVAGKITFNNGSTAAYLIWSNNYVLTLGANGGPFPYGVGPHGYTGYFGALDLGAVFVKNINPLFGTDGIILGGKLTLGSNKVLVDAEGTSSQSLAGYVLTVNASGYPAWRALPSGGSSGETINRSNVSDFWAAPFWNSIPDKPSSFPVGSHASSHLAGGSDPINFSGVNTTFGNIVLTGTIGTTGGALTLTPDVNFAHLGTVYVNLNSTNSGQVSFNLQSGGSTKASFGWNGAKAYMVAAVDVNGTPISEMHILGSKIVLENDTVFNGLAVINRSSPVFTMQHNGNDRLQWGYNFNGDGHNYFRARNAGNMDFVNESGAINFTTSTGQIFLAGGAQFCPTLGGTGQLGNSTYWWLRVYLEELWTHNYSGHTFDSLDDLSLVKQYGEPNPTIPEDYDSSKLRPKSNDVFSFLKSEDGQFYNILDMVNFSLGCAKALANKHDENSDIMLALYDGIDTHDAEIQALKEENKELKSRIERLEKEKN